MLRNRIVNDPKPNGEVYHHIYHLYSIYFCHIQCILYECEKNFSKTKVNLDKYKFYKH